MPDVAPIQGYHEIYGKWSGGDWDFTQLQRGEGLPEFEDRSGLYLKDHRFRTHMRSIANDTACIGFAKYNGWNIFSVLVPEVSFDRAGRPARMDHSFVTDAPMNFAHFDHMKAREQFRSIRAGRYKAEYYDKRDRNGNPVPRSNRKGIVFESDIFSANLTAKPVEIPDVDFTRNILMLPQSYTDAAKVWLDARPNGSIVVIDESQSRNFRDRYSEGHLSEEFIPDILVTSKVGEPTVIQRTPRNIENKQSVNEAFPCAPGYQSPLQDRLKVSAGQILEPARAQALSPQNLAKNDTRTSTMHASTQQPPMQSSETAMNVRNLPTEACMISNIAQFTAQHFDTALTFHEDDRVTIDTRDASAVVKMYIELLGAQTSPAAPHLILFDKTMADRIGAAYKQYRGDFRTFFQRILTECPGAIGMEGDQVVVSPDVIGSTSPTLADQTRALFNQKSGVVKLSPKEQEWLNAVQYKRPGTSSDKLDTTLKPK